MSANGSTIKETPSVPENCTQLSIKDWYMPYKRISVLSHQKHGPMVPYSSPLTTRCGWLMSLSVIKAYEDKKSKCGSKDRAENFLSNCEILSLQTNFWYYMTAFLKKVAYLGKKNVPWSARCCSCRRTDGNVRGWSTPRPSLVLPREPAMKKHDDKHRGQSCGASNLSLALF